MPTPDPAAPAPPPWRAFQDSLETALNTQTSRPLRVRMRWEYYDHTKGRYVNLRGATFSYALPVAGKTYFLAERIWRAIYVLLS